MPPIVTSHFGARRFRGNARHLLWNPFHNSGAGPLAASLTDHRCSARAKPIPAALGKHAPALIRTRLFVSAVSTELGSARRLVADTLRKLGFDTVTQDDFPTGPGELRAWLEQQIAGCEGVFQLVGLAYGREPPLSDAPGRPWPDPAFGRCSYTQFELLYAQRLRKHTWVIEVGPGCRRDREPAQLDLPPTRDGEPPHPDPAAYQAERRALQLAYVERLRAANHLRHRVDSDAELENRVLRLKDELAQLRARQERHQRRLGWGLGGVFATLLLVGGGLLWSIDRTKTTLVAQTAAQQQITTERIRAHLLTAVEDAYRRDLQAATAAADWQAREQQRQAAAAQRAAQVARIDDLAASFAAIEARGEASSVFTELTRILKEQGVDPALAYVASKRVGILDQVRNRQAAARQRNRDDLQPLLTSAGLYAAKGEGESARALYREVLELEPEWPEALDATWQFLIAQGDRAISSAPFKAALNGFAGWAFASMLPQAHPPVESDCFEPRPEAEPDLRGRALVTAFEFMRTSIRADCLKATHDYSEAHSIAARLTAVEPDNEKSQGYLLSSQTKLDDTNTAQDHFSGTLANIETLVIATSLGHADPKNADWLRNVAANLNRIGEIKAARGDLAGALAAYELSLAITERLAASNPCNAGWQRDLAMCHYKLGKIADRQGREDLLRQHWGETLAIFAAMQQRGLHVSPEDLAELETIRARVQGTAR